MNISNRLKTIASFVENDAYIIDVGCDHALLDIYLALNNKTKNIIASDINIKPLESAKENIKKYNLENKIKVVLQDGIKDIDKYNIDTIVISGMGTSLIIDILFNDKSKLNNIKNIIISSNNDYYKLRSTFVKNGYYISDEKIVHENKKYYPIISFKKGLKKYNKFSLEYGPILIEKKDNIFINYIKKNLNKKKEIYKSLPNKYLYKKILLKREIRLLEKI